MKWVGAQSQEILSALNEGVAAKTRVKTGAARAGWKIKKNIKKVGDTGVIQNEVPYIGWLNFGSRTVSADHMVEKTILEIQRQYPVK